MHNLFSPKYLLFYLFFVFSSWIIFGDLIGNDAYFHIKLSSFYSSFDSKTLPWMYFTEYRNFFPDHHWLYHVILKIFVIPLGVVGAKISVIFFTGTLLFLFIYILNKYSVSHIYYWVILLFLSTHFLIRISMVRVQCFSIILLIYAIYLLVERKRKCLFLLSIIYTWSYSAYVFLIPLIFIDMLVSYLQNEKIDLNISAWVIFGIVVGCVVNPFFPGHISFIVDFIFKRLNYSKSLPMGGEWYPFDIFELLRGQYSLLFVLFVFQLYPLLVKTNISRKTLFYFFVTLLFFIFMAKSGRFIEYFVPISIIYLACLSKDNNLVELLQYYCFKIHIYYRFLINALLLFILILQINYYFIESQRISYPIERFKYASEWLKSHSNEGDIVFNIDWSDFPQLFFWNSTNYYVCGLDPNFINSFDKELANTYFKVHSGEYEGSFEVVKEKFNSQYIIISKTNHVYYQNINNMLFDRKEIKLVFDSKYSTIYQIISIH